MHSKQVSTYITRAHTPHMTAIPAVQEEDENEGEETKTDPNAGKLQGNREPHKAWASGSACTRCLVPRCSLLRGPTPPIQGFPEKVRGEGGRALF